MRETFLSRVRSRQSLATESRGLVRAGAVRVRSPFQRFRVLPDFLVIGTQRGGTTSLYHYLSMHPQVHGSVGKELQFFTLHWGKGVSWYRSHFPLARTMEHAGTGSQTFEASPYYLYHPHAPGRAALTLPGSRAIALLRDPVERAHSHYLHNRRLGYEPLSFEAALRAEPARIGPDLDRMAADERYCGAAHRRFSYIDRGRYLPQVERWRREYGDHLLLVRSESLYRDPAATYARILDFLGLDQWAPSAFKQHTKRTSAQPETMDPAVRDWLRTVFEEPNEQLVAALGEEFRW